jgi:hypothetical protein
MRACRSRSRRAFESSVWIGSDRAASDRLGRLTEPEWATSLSARPGRRRGGGEAAESTGRPALALANPPVAGPAAPAGSGPTAVSCVVSVHRRSRPDRGALVPPEEPHPLCNAMARRRARRPCRDEIGPESSADPTASAVCRRLNARGAVRRRRGRTGVGRRLPSRGGGRPENPTRSIDGSGRAGPGALAAGGGVRERAGPATRRWRRGATGSARRGGAGRARGRRRKRGGGRGGRSGARESGSSTAHGARSGAASGRSRRCRCRRRTAGCRRRRGGAVGDAVRTDPERRLVGVLHRRP